MNSTYQYVQTPARRFRCEGSKFFTQNVLNRKSYSSMFCELFDVSQLITVCEHDSALL